MNRLFTDAIKDVIGGEPIFDEFDISYVASFYGTMQDDFVTGSFMSASISSEGNIVKFLDVGKRGRVFSKQYASSQPVPGLSAAELSTNPYAARREIPWEAFTSNTLRVTQHIDSKERIYDTCLPSLVESLKVDNSEPWTVKHQTSDSNNDYFLSPTQNFPTSNNCFILFNDVEGGKNLQNAKGINNTWCYSYPFENRYNPEKRFLKPESQIRGIENVGLAQWFRPDIGYNEIDVTKKRYGYLVPMFAGNYHTGSRQNSVAVAPGGRDSLRGTYYLPTGSAADTRYDELLGYSYTIVADVNYSSITNAGTSDDTRIGGQYLTSSAVPSDTLKSLYGFGDVNSVTYPIFNEVPNSGTLSYSLNLGYLGDTIGISSNAAVVQTNCSYAAQYESGVTPPYSSYFSINWAVNPQLRASFSGDTSKYRNWGVIQATSKTPGTIKTVPNYYVSASSVSPYSPTSLNGVLELRSGVTWPWRRNIWYPSTSRMSGTTGPSTLTSKYNNFNIFASNTSATGGSQGLGGVSIMSFDVTSSLAWQMSYERVVASAATNYLVTYISKEHTAVDDYDYNWGYDNFDLPYALPDGYETKNISAKQHKVIETVYGDGGDVNDFHEMTPYESSIFPPGEYRLNFSYVKPIDSTETGIDRAFVSALDIRLWDPLSVSGSYAVDYTKRAGWNKEPDFRRKFVDPRQGITYTGTWSDAEKNNDLQKFRAKAFGLAPVIRGWKYGLYSALPVNSKSIFRRNRFGQFRDMLEQRIFTKCVTDPNPRLTDVTGISSLPSSTSKNSVKEAKDVRTIGEPVTVKFVKRKYFIGPEEYDKNIGKIYNEVVFPQKTTSHNLGNSAESSLPYFDGEARQRPESDYYNNLSTVNY